MLIHRIPSTQCSPSLYQGRLHTADKEKVKIENVFHLNSHHCYHNVRIQIKIWSQESIYMSSEIGQRSSIMHKICGIHLQGNIKLPDICHFLLCWMVVWLCCGDGEDLLVLVGKWADPGGTAMPGQPVTRPEQAPEPHPLAKISLISKGAHGPRIRY